MTRESRYNLVFLAALLVLTGPAFVLVFRQKLASTARSNAEPDPVPRTLVYIAPQETPPGMTRVLPPRTAAWRESLCRDFSGQTGGSPKGSDGLPVTSDRQRFELLALDRDRAEIHMLVLVWDKGLTGPETTWAIDDAPVKFEREEQTQIPQPVREELGENGLLVPPKTLLLKSLRLPSSKSVRRLTARDAKGTIDSLNIVPSFTNPVTTAN